MCIASRLIVTSDIHLRVQHIPKGQTLFHEGTRCIVARAADACANAELCVCSGDRFSPRVSRAYDISPLLITPSKLVSTLRKKSSMDLTQFLRKVRGHAPCTTSLQSIPAGRETHMQLDDGRSPSGSCDSNARVQSACKRASAAL